jgi:glycogen(starch) synthase
VFPLDQHRFPVDWRQYDAIHLHSLALTELALELRRRSGRPLIYTVHSLLRLELDGSLPSRFWRAVQELLMASSDRLVFLSAFERDTALKRSPALAERSCVVPNGLPAPAAPPSLPESDAPVVFAGRFTRLKGVEVVAQLVPRVLQRQPVHFVLAGGHGDALGERIVRELQRRYAQACRVVGWLGREHLDALFARAALVMVPSLYEPFGLVALESMRMGAPVLAAAVGGLTEIVRGDSGGRLIPAHDPDHWSEAIVDLLDDAAARRTLRQRGPRYVATHFDSDRLAMRLLREAYAA